MLIDEEVYWRQKSRADWLREGDKNTKFFHSKASAREERTEFRALKMLRGGNRLMIEEVEKEFCEYFQKLFSSPGQVRARFEKP